MNTGKKRCGAVKYYLEFWTSEGKSDNLKIKLVESVSVPNNFLEQKIIAACEILSGLVKFP